MSLPLVVLTYPGHFFFTVLTVQSYLQHHTDPSSIHILVDDLSPHAWPGYVEDCVVNYKEFDPHIVRTSQLVFLQNFVKNGWIRQQMIKLYLDRLLSFDQWFYTDGDIIFLNAVDINTLPYSEPESSEVSSLNHSYVAKILGVDANGIYKDTKRVCVSNPAFRSMHKTTLQDLRQFVEYRHQQPFDRLHESYQIHHTASMSEWELIENFRKHVLGQDLELVKYAPHDYSCKGQKLDFFKHQFLTCYSTDGVIGPQWFRDQGLDHVDRFWPQVEKITR